MSLALTDTVTLPDTCEPVAGDVMIAVGGSESDTLFWTVTLTDAAVMAAVYGRGGNPVTLKTLSELDGLGRPNIGALRSRCGRLVNKGHLRPAG